MEFFIATKNQHKITEFKAIFESVGHTLVTENDIVGVMPEPEENGTTFEENALIKAKAGLEFSGRPTIADDSGLCVDYLGGAPGIHSARYAGEHETPKNNEKLLRELNGVPMDKRTARFVSVIACVFPDGRSFTVRGECEGKIAEKPQGNGGFGYDPLFISEIGCFGVITPEQKNSISHRSKSVAKFKEEILKYI
ncbi:MAG: RdgB/HAM1 family non-canonical purine NTP pyrophosphatase [Clostridiales bacterium]|nr:RdgB/HAM1 family non-canonical purine NTP pyrophosphatase [Candidatus Equinaster intestinalis]